MNDCHFAHFEELVLHFFFFSFFPPVYTVFGLSFLSCGAWSSETFPQYKTLTPDCLSLNRQCRVLCCWETPSHGSVFNSFIWWFAITNQRFSSHCPDGPFPANLSVPSSKQTLLPYSLSFVIPIHPMFTGAATEIRKVVQKSCAKRGHFQTAKMEENCLIPVKSVPWSFVDKSFFPMCPLFFNRCLLPTLL